jgi:hypothetical protein
MNFLVISSWVFNVYSPRAIRTYELVREFLEKGHHVTLVCHKINVPEDILSRQNLTIINIRVPRYQSIKLGKHILLRIIERFCNRLLYWFFEYPMIQYYFIVRSALKRLHVYSYDALISIAQPYPLHWGIASFLRKNSIAKLWIADCGDPYALVQNDTVRKMFYFKWMEKWFMRKCDYITIPILEGIDFYYPEFHHKIVIIPQGLSFPEAKPKGSQNNSPISTSKNKVQIGYAGNITAYQKRAKHLFKALTGLTQDFHFTAFADNPKFYQENMSIEVFSKCSIYNRVDRMQMLTYLEDMDFLIYIPYEKPGQRPFKLIDYTFLDKPILEYKADEWSVKILHQFMQGDFTYRYSGVKLEEHRIEVVAQSFIDLINKKITPSSNVNVFS